MERPERESRHIRRLDSHDTHLQGYLDRFPSLTVSRTFATYVRMRLNATKLRSDLYRILDRVLETGEPAEVERRGRLLRITPVAPSKDLDALPARPDRILGDPDDLVTLGWADEWRAAPPPVRRAGAPRLAKKR